MDTAITMTELATARRHAEHSYESGKISLAEFTTEMTRLEPGAYEDSPAVLAPAPPPPPTELKIAQLQREADYHRQESEKFFLELRNQLNAPPDPFQKPLALLGLVPDPATARDCVRLFVEEGFWSAEEAEAFGELILCDTNLEPHQST